MIVEEVQVYLLVDLHFDCYVNNNLKFQKLHVIATWGECPRGQNVHHQ